MIHEVLEITAPGTEHVGKLYTYFWSPSQEIGTGKVRPVILICPGGGYERTSDREAEPLALEFMRRGYHAAVLRYSCGQGIHYPVALDQLGRSVALLRSRAGEWGIDPDQIVVLGCSAGGHLAASLGVFWKKDKALQERLGLGPEDIRPNGLMLCYPVITSGPLAHEGSFRNLLGDRYEAMKEDLSLENQVSGDVPVTFLWHTLEDKSVPMENSLLFLSALRREGIPAEFHLFPQGIHGLSLASKLVDRVGGGAIQEDCQIWTELAAVWMERYFKWD